MNDLVSKSEVISEIESLISHYSWRLHDNSLSQEDFMIIISGKLNVLKEVLISIKKICPLNLASKSAWISCDDRLPETSNCVLITDGENVEISRYDEGVWRTESPCCYGEILYWQPLPDIREIYLETHEKEKQ